MANEILAIKTTANCKKPDWVLTQLGFLFALNQSDKFAKQIELPQYLC
jgi:hypothetical protein